MSVDFSRQVNTNMDTTPFTEVIFGKGGSLLEVELNEAQKIQNSRWADFFNQFTGSTIANEDFVTVKDGSFIVNGYIVFNSSLLRMNKISVSGATEGASLYIFKESDIIDKNTKITEYGYFKGKQIANTMVDDRVGIETSRRYGTFYDLSTSNIGTLLATVKDGKVQYNRKIFSVGNYEEITAEDVVTMYDSLVV